MDPGVTFVAGIEEGGDPEENDAPYALDNVIGGAIPLHHSEAAAFGSGPLLDALKAALPELEARSTAELGQWRSSPTLALDRHPDPQRHRSSTVMNEQLVKIGF